MKIVNSEQIKNNIEACVERECENCSYDEQTSCKETMLYEVLALITSQEQKIKELTEERKDFEIRALRAENVALETDKMKEKKTAEQIFQEIESILDFQEEQLDEPSDMLTVIKEDVAKYKEIIIGEGK